jgi:hypothetical protein
MCPDEKENSIRVSPEDTSNKKPNKRMGRFVAIIMCKTNHALDSNSIRKNLHQSFRMKKYELYTRLELLRACRASTVAAISDLSDESSVERKHSSSMARNQFMF